MEELEPPAGRSLRLALVAFALLALLAVVAFASRSGLGHTSSASPTPAYVDYAFTAFLIVFVLAIPVAAYAFLIQAREGGIARKSFRSRVLSNIATAAFFGLIAFVVIYLKRHHGHFLSLDTSALRKSQDALTHRPNGGRAGYQPRFEWTVLWIAIAGIGAGATWFTYSYRRQKRRGTPRLEAQADVTDDLAASISDAIDDLEAEPDARKAVIAAYARMEAVLARSGLRRRASETPLEYLRRILLGLTERADAVRRLTSLFEQARFSRHDVDASMKHEAIGALREIRDDLRGGAA